MDDARKLAAAAARRKRKDPETTSNDTSASFVAFMDDSVEPGSGATGQPQKARAEKALDRWFSKRQKNQGAPRLLEVPNEALVTGQGPLQITGNITLVDEDGSVRYANHLTLCRCGHSDSKPDCSGRHLEVEFIHSGKITEASEIARSSRPSKITISCIKDGPITFRGRLRLHNALGQECVKMRGALCRCGQSASKPFCDGSHERTGFRSGR